MPRKLREISQTGVYHVILRGVNRQRIFEWPEDYDAFLDILHRVMNQDNQANPSEPNYQIYAYCLMDNHVHLLIREQLQPLSVIVKRIASAYAQHFNLRYHRVGHLFQDRYRSEPCNDAKYLLTLYDYIHNNPVRGGVVASPLDYSYCSFPELMGKPTQDPLCTIPNDFPDIFADEIRRWLKDMPIADSIDSAEEKQAATPPSSLSDLPESSREERSLSTLCNLRDNSEDVDQLIVSELLRLSSCLSVSEFQRLPKKQMRNALAILRDAGVSIRRLSRLSGISEGVIRGCKNPANLPQPPAFPE